MKKRSVRIEALYRFSLFALVFLSWASGVGFFVLDRFLRVEGDFGPERHPWQPTVLEVHGAAAFLMMIAFGALLAAHVPAGWKVHRLRAVGAALVTLLGVLVVSGHLLYYLGDADLREVVGYVHLGLGVALPALRAGHLLQGRRQRRRRGRRAASGVGPRRVADAGSPSESRRAAEAGDALPRRRAAS